jgi:glycosyltransferase involved in cell wall biosynthesis
MNNICIIGVYPPPVGGVSIHIRRLAYRLKKMEMLNVVYNFYNSEYSIEDKNINIKNLSYHLNRIVSMFRLFTHLLFFDKSKLIHLHNEEMFAPFIFMIYVLTRKKIIFSMHDQMRYEKKSTIKFLIRHIFLKLLNCSKAEFIVVNVKIYNQFFHSGIDKKRIHLIPAHLEPENENEPLGQYIIDFSAKFDLAFSIYAFDTKKFKGFNLYGIDLALQLISYLKNEGFSTGLVILIPGFKDPIQFQDYKNFIAKNKIEDNVLFITEIINNTSELWSISNVHLRLTNTDGDSLTVREALSVGTTVIASDVVNRPDGCYLFQNRNLDDLIETAKICIEDISAKKTKSYIAEDNFLKILNIYKTLSNE